MASLTASPAPPPPRTRTEALRRQIADEIVSGALRPGTPLDEMDLARRFGVSRTPVREAIRLLTASGLVETRAHRGASVAHPAPERLSDMFQAMAELEGLCAGLAAIRMTPRERRELEMLHRDMAGLARRDDPDRYNAMNEVFHGAIYAGAHNDYLAEMTLQTRTRVSPFRRAQFRASGRTSLSHAEHEAVVQAIQRGDREAAASAMRDHIDIVRDAYVRYVEAV